VAADPISRTGTRVLLLVLMFQGFFPGGWALVAPRSFYDDFPGVRMGWVSADGPFNEHLLRDVGSMFLALGVLAAIAAVSGSLVAARCAGAAWLTFTVPHCVYHLFHLHVHQPLDQWLNIVTLVGSVVVSAAVLAAPVRRPRLESPPSTSHSGAPS
jgi:hypothetical protein